MLKKHMKTIRPILIIPKDLSNSLDSDLLKS